MILQALNDYYQRKMSDPDPARRLPAFGFEDKEIPFVIELGIDGSLAGIKDTRSGDGKKKTAARFLVPKGVKRAFGVAANLLWDTAEYAVGVDTKGKPDRVAKQHTAFRARIDTLPEAAQADDGIVALRAFLDSQPREALAADPMWDEICSTNPVMTFRLEQDTDLICQRPAIVQVASLATGDGEGQNESLCLVTGEHLALERLHNAIKGVWGAQTAGANIVSINNKNENGSNGGQTPAFASFNKQQGYNSPISKHAAFAYTTALNHLLAKGSAQRIQVGDASTVFWAQRQDEVEDVFAQLFGETDDPDARTGQVRALLEAIHSGKFDGGRGENRFFVLGLAPNAARIAVRFWHAAPLKEIASHVAAWFRDLEVDRGPNDPEYPALRRLLGSLCLATKERPLGDIDRLPPVIGGDVMRSILSDGELPATLLSTALQRCRAEQARKDDRTGKHVRHVSYLRAAVIKAFINRSFRKHAPNRKEMTVSLDRTNTDKPYLLGRLFATFERMQEAAAERQLNRSIRDSFFGAAMATPRSVFPRLVRLNQQHLRDLKRGRPKSAGYFDRLLRDINDNLDPKSAFPASLSLKDQGVFAIGYYHQRQDFYPKAPTDSDLSLIDDSASTTEGNLK